MFLNPMGKCKVNYIKIVKCKKEKINTITARIWIKENVSNKIRNLTNGV